MIFPVKIIDAKGKVKDGECLNKDQALENFWINKHKSNKKGNTPMYYLSAAERKTWNTMTKEEIIRKQRERRAKNKAETGYTEGYSQAGRRKKKKAEAQGEGTLKAFL